jgi:hypothetical protein
MNFADLDHVDFGILGDFTVFGHDNLSEPKLFGFGKALIQSTYRTDLSG